MELLYLKMEARLRRDQLEWESDIKTQVIHTTRRGKSILLFPFPTPPPPPSLPLAFLHDRYIPIRALVITLLRNVMLTIPKGAWVTCALHGWPGNVKNLS